ncbi:MAG TPA: DinB family protein [Aggregatilineales bacterium]|nr:DinB family protein [Aggregatilineales bacterium]
MPELDDAVMDNVYKTLLQDRSQPLTEKVRIYSVEELLRAFHRQRQAIIALLADLDDVQINYNPDAENFSISQIVSHLVTAQNGTYHAMLELSQIVLPHLDHAAPIPGAGARKDLSAAECRTILPAATEELDEMMRQAARSDQTHVVEYPLFGKMNYKSWMLFQLWHDQDHLRQIRALTQNTGFPKKELPPIKDTMGIS